MAFESGYKIFQIHMSIVFQMHDVKNNKLVLTFFGKNDFSGFFICVINGPGVSFGQTAIY